MKDDVDVASLVVALMGPFEDRITALEQELTDMRCSIEQCVTYEEFELLKSELGCAVTKQKATAVMCVHTMHELRAINGTQTAQQPVSESGLDAAGPSKKKAQLKGEVAKGNAKGKVYRTPVRPPRPEPERDTGSQQDAEGEDSSAFKFNFVGDEDADCDARRDARGDARGGVDKPGQKGSAKGELPVTKKQKSKASKQRAHGGLEDPPVNKLPSPVLSPAEEPSAFAFNFQDTTPPEVAHIDLPGASTTNHGKRAPSEGVASTQPAPEDHSKQAEQPVPEAGYDYEQHMRPMGTAGGHYIAAAQPPMTAKQQARDAKKKQKEVARLSAEAEEAAAVAEAKSRLSHELAWCIAQLDAGLLQPGELIEQQVKESEKVRKILLSSKTPLVRKRHTMKLVFGDYRNLMKTLTVPDDLLQAATQTLREAGSID